MEAQELAPVLGLVGKGYWGGVYRGVLQELGIGHWHAGRDWEDKKPDGLIIASSTDSHYEIACRALANGVPVLVEKPVARTASEARELVSFGRHSLRGSYAAL